MANTKYNKRESYVIRLTRPAGVSVQELKRYIEDAIRFSQALPNDLWDIGDYPIQVERMRYSPPK